MARGTGWRRFPALGLRGRLVALGTAGFALALVVSGVILVVGLRFGLERTIDAGAEQTARDVAILVDADALPPVIPVGGTAVVQVVDGRGRVRGASVGADLLVPMLNPDGLADVRDHGGRYADGHRFGVDGVVWVVAHPAGPSTDRQTVMVAVPASEIEDSVRFVQVVLFTGYGVLLCVVIALVWRMVGAALRPVEELRQGAEEITGAQSTARLPVPRARDEVHRLAVTLNDMLARLEGARTRQRAFVADAAHELRSPLASLRTQIEVAAVVGLPDGATGRAEFLADALTDVERLSRLVDDLLVLATADDAPRLARVDRVDLRAVAAEVAERQAGARVPVWAHPGSPDGGLSGSGLSDGEPSDGRPLDGGPPPVVTGDRDQLLRVVGNLVENAVRYAATGVELRVGVRAQPRADADRDPVPELVAAIEVIDDGPGIPVADRARVFERFTRLDKARDRDRGGAGLGLAIVRELVRRHGGEVGLGDAAPGAEPPGLRAWAWFPLAAPDDVDPPPERPVERAPVESERGS